MEPNLLEGIFREQANLSTEVKALRRQVDSHEEVILSVKQTNESMQEMLELFISAKGGFTVLGWIGKFAKWCWPPIAIIGAIIVYIKSGEWRLKL